MFRYALAGLMTAGLLAPAIVLAADTSSTNVEIVRN